MSLPLTPKQVAVEILQRNVAIACVRIENTSGEVVGYAVRDASTGKEVPDVNVLGYSAMLYRASHATRLQANTGYFTIKGANDEHHLMLVMHDTGNPVGKSMSRIVEGALASIRPAIITIPGSVALSPTPYQSDPTARTVRAYGEV